MNFLSKTWSWIKGNLDWVCIGANAVLVAGVVYYTVQSVGVSTRYEIQNEQLIQQNQGLLNQNQNLRGILNKASGYNQEQNKHIQKQEIFINMQNEAIKKLLQRVKELERLLNDDFIAAS